MLVFMSGVSDSTIISVRLDPQQPATFMSLADIKKEQDIQKVTNIYLSIANNCTNYVDEEKTKDLYLKVVEEISNKICAMHQSKYDVLTIEGAFQEGYAHSFDNGPHWLLSVLTCGLYDRLFWKLRSIAIEEMKKTYNKAKSHLVQQEPILKVQRALLMTFRFNREMDQKAEHSSLTDQLKSLERHPGIKYSLDLLRAKTEKVARCQREYQLTLPKLVAYARSLEIAERFKNYYYVFNHGNPAHIAVFFLLLGELYLSLSDEDKVGNEIGSLRHPQQLKNTSRKVSWYVDHLSQKGNTDGKGEMGTELIAADAYLDSTVCGESALDYFLKNGSSRKIDWIEDLLRPIIGRYIREENVDKFLERLRLLVQDPEFPLGEGNLVAIIVPKEKFSEVGFLSSAYGKPYKSDQTEAAELELSQNPIRGRPVSAFPVEALDDDQSGATTPQVRLVAHELQKAEGVEMFSFNTLSPALKQRLRFKLRFLIEQARNHL